MFVKTSNSYGVNEVLLASVLGCVVFGVLACQPLVIVGVTGKDFVRLLWSACVHTNFSRSNHGVFLHSLRYRHTGRIQFLQFHGLGGHMEFDNALVSGHHELL